MELANEQVSTPARSLTSSTERRHPSKVDYISELRCWVLHVIREAERERDFKKRARFLNLLKDLQNRPWVVIRIGLAEGEKTLWDPWKTKYQPASTSPFSQQNMKLTQTNFSMRWPPRGKDGKPDAEDSRSNAAASHKTRPYFLSWKTSKLLHNSQCPRHSSWNEATQSKTSWRPTWSADTWIRKTREHTLSPLETCGPEWTTLVWRPRC